MNFIQSTISTLFKPKKICFQVHEERTEYHCLLPDEIMTIILTMVGNIQCSFVNYQFYTINRPFVVKCYHLHHFIPIVKRNINRFTLNVISFNEVVKLYKFNRMDYDKMKQIKINKYDTNLLDIINFDMNTRVKLSMVIIDNENISETGYLLVTEILQNYQMLMIVLKYKDIILAMLEKELNMNTLYNIYVKIVDQLSTEDQHFINDFFTKCSFIYGLSIEALLNIFDAHTNELHAALFKKEDVKICGDIWSYDKRKQVYDIYKRDLNFNIDVTKTIIFEYGLGIHYLNNPFLSPEYKWFAQQL